MGRKAGERVPALVLVDVEVLPVLHRMHVRCQLEMCATPASRVGPRRSVVAQGPHHAGGPSLYLQQYK